MTAREWIQEGDKHAKAGDTPQAIAAYREAITIFRGEQMWLKAFALTKQILALDPNHADARADHQELGAKLGISV